MNKNILLYIALFLFCISAKAQRVGVNTLEPKVTLDIASNLDANMADGLMVPKITGSELKAKDNLYKETHDGMMLFVTSPLEESEVSFKTEKVIEKGYFFYESEVGQWLKMDSYMNVATGKTIAQISAGNQQQLSSTDRAVVWQDAIGNQTDDIVLVNNNSEIRLAPGKVFKLTGIIGVGGLSSSTYLRTKFESQTPLTGGAVIYVSTEGGAASSSLNVSKGVGSYPVCILYTGSNGLDISLMARGPQDGRVTYLAGRVTSQSEGTLVIVEEL